jgi:hypothetical protein
MCIQSRLTAHHPAQPGAHQISLGGLWITAYTRNPQVLP